MSVLTKPDGDAVAKSFGKYMSLNELKSIKVGNKVDILCNSSVHYVAKVTRIDDALEGRLKWVACGVSQEYFGSFRSIYISTEGKYSSTAHNTQLIEDARVAKNKKESGRSKYIEGTKYDADFLARPYRENERKRKVLDPSEMMMLPDRTRTKRVSLPENTAGSGSNVSSNSNEGEAAVRVASTVAQHLPNLSRLLGSANTGAPAATDAAKVNSTTNSLTSATVIDMNVASTATPAAITTTSCAALPQGIVVSAMSSAVIPASSSTTIATVTSTTTSVNTSATTSPPATVNARNAKNPTMASSDPSANLPALPPWLPPPTTKYTSAYSSGATPGPRINMLRPLYTLDYTTGEICINYENIPHRVKSATLVEGSKDAYRVRVVDESSDSDSEYDVKDASNPRVRPTRSNTTVKGKDVKRIIHGESHSTRSGNASEDSTVSRPTHIRDRHTQSDKLYNTVYAQYYAHYLSNSTNNLYRDCGTALHFPNNKIYTLYSTKRLKGTVYGPLGMYIQTHQKYIALTVQHAIPEHVLLTYVVCNEDDLEILSSLFNQLRVRVNVVCPQVKLNIHRDIHRWCVMRYMYTSPTILNILAGLVPELNSTLYSPNKVNRRYKLPVQPHVIRASVKKPILYSMVQEAWGISLQVHEILHGEGASIKYDGDQYHDGSCFEARVLFALDNNVRLVFSNRERCQRLQEFAEASGEAGTIVGPASATGSRSSGCRSENGGGSGSGSSGGGGKGGGSGGGVDVSITRHFSGQMEATNSAHLTVEASCSSDGTGCGLGRGVSSASASVSGSAGGSFSGSSRDDDRVAAVAAAGTQAEQQKSNLDSVTAAADTVQNVNTRLVGNVIRGSLPVRDVVDLCDSDSSDDECLFLDASSIPTVTALAQQTARPTATAASLSVGTVPPVPKLSTNSASMNGTRATLQMTTQATNTTYITWAHASTTTNHSTSSDASSQTILHSTSDACSSTVYCTATTGTNTRSKNVASTGTNTLVASARCSSTTTTTNPTTSNGTAMSTPDPVSNPACSSDAIQSVIATLTAFSNLSDEELIARNVDPIAVRALLLAQTKLACALHEMLK